MKPSAWVERFLFREPVAYKIKCFLIEQVLWKRVLSGLFGLAPNPMPSLDACFAGKRVLVAACGPGDVSTGPSVDGAAEVHAFDLSHEFVEACRKNRPGWTVFQGDIAQIPHPDRAFDVTVLYSSLHHIPLHAEKVLGELARVTRERIILVEGLAPERGPLRHALLAWWALVDGGVHYYTRPEIEGVFSRLKLEIEGASQHGPIRHMLLAVLRPPAAAAIAA